MDGSEIFRFAELFLGGVASVTRPQETVNQAQSTSHVNDWQNFTIPNVLTVSLVTYGSEIVPFVGANRITCWYGQRSERPALSMRTDVPAPD